MGVAKLQVQLGGRGFEDVVDHLVANLACLAENIFGRDCIICFTLAADAIQMRYFVVNALLEKGLLVPGLASRYGNLLPCPVRRLLIEPLNFRPGRRLSLLPVVQHLVFVRRSLGVLLFGKGSNLGDAVCFDTLLRF